MAGAGHRKSAFSAYSTTCRRLGASVKPQADGIYDLTLLIYSVFTSEKDVRCRQNSIAAKWNIFLSFGLKVPFGFPCFAHVCLESWLGLVFFSTAYVTLVVALLFGGLVLLLAFLQGFFNRFLSLRCSTVTLLEAGALACFYEWMDSVSDFATYA